MRLKFGNHSFDTASGVSIAIPLDFGGKQVNAWDVPRCFFPLRPKQVN